MENIVNLTPHNINIITGYCSGVVLPASGQVARVTAKTVTYGEIAGIPLTRTEFGEVTDLPEPREGTIFVVSALVAQRCRDRDDVFVPNESVRDANGRIIGCRSLGKV